MFASFKATVLTLQRCPPRSVIITGLCGATSSKSQRFGGLPSARRVVSQPCPTIQLRLGFSLVLFLTISLISSIDRASRTSKIVDESMRPYSIRCTWESANPGRSVFPSRSMTFASFPATDNVSSLLPTPMIVPSLIAIASALGLWELRVITLPFTKTNVSGTSPFQFACPRTKKVTF